MDLLDTPPEILDHMIRFTLGRAVNQPSDWERLNQEII